MFQQFQGIVPEAIYLDRFSASRCDHPIIHLRIHPRQLITRRTLAKQSIRRIYLYSETCPTQMMFHNIDELWENRSQRAVVVRKLNVTIQGMKKPQRRV